jgi:hypothetical protein
VRFSVFERTLPIEADRREPEDLPALSSSGDTSESTLAPQPFAVGRRLTHACATSATTSPPFHVEERPGGVGSPVMGIRDTFAEAREEALRQKERAKGTGDASPDSTPARSASTNGGYEYKVVEVRDSLFRGKQSSDALQSLLNEHARQGWKFSHMMSDDIKGRLGIGSTSGVLIVFERRR